MCTIHVRLIDLGAGEGLAAFPRNDAARKMAAYYRSEQIPVDALMRATQAGDALLIERIIDNVVFVGFPRHNQRRRRRR